MSITFRPIGTLRSPFTELEGMPIQPTGAQEHEGRAEILPEFRDGLQDLDGFNHIYLIYHLHAAGPGKLRVVPFMDAGGVERGIFSTRSPRRPNPLGMSLVRLLSVENGVIRFQGADILDGTPLIDIKPYIAHFDRVEAPTCGWMKGSLEDVAARRSDDRFLT